MIRTFLEKFGPSFLIVVLVFILSAILSHDSTPKYDISSGSASTSQAKLLLGEKIDINTASIEDFDQLPGVGPATAENIIKYRNAHGSFKNISELENVDGIGPATMKKIEPYVGMTN